MKNYVLFVLVVGENIFHSVQGHEASWDLCGERRKYELLKLLIPSLSTLGAEAVLVSTHP